SRSGRRQRRSAVLWDAGEFSPSRLPQFSPLAISEVRTSWDERMGVENFQNADAGSKRSAKRARVLLAARLQTPFGEVEARLRDLSRKGALIECMQVPPVGTEVVFVRG